MTLQLTLLDITGADTGVRAEIQWLPVANLSPHPDNPRLIYRQDIIDTIADSIRGGGFKPEYALLVRPIEQGYQVISGHTRLKAAQQAGCSVLPCWVKDLDDEAAFMELVLANNQGELTPLEYGMHVLKYVELSEGGRGKKGGLSEYARVVGKAKDTISGVKLAAEVFSKLSDRSDSLLEKSTHLAAIHKAPEADWPWLVGELVEQGWSVRQTESAVEAIDGLEVDERLRDWLKPRQYKKQAVAEAVKGGQSDIVHRVTRWSKTAVDCLEKLEESRPVWLFKDCLAPDGGESKDAVSAKEPYRETLNPREMFLSKLVGIGHPSDKKILDLQSSILNYLNKCDSAYEQWLASQQDAEESRRQAEAAAKAESERRASYTPDGYNSDFRECDLGIGFADLILTDPPYLLSNDGFTLRSGKEVSVNKNFDDVRGVALAPSDWVPVIADWLRPGGVLIATCTLHILRELWDECQKAGLETEREQGIWYKSNSPPQMMPDRLRPDFEYIFIAFKPGDKFFFGYDDYRERYGDQPSRTFDIPQCGGKERLGWHDTQKPLDLFDKLITLYSPVDGLVVDPFAGSGTAAVSSKRLQRRCVWIEKDPSHFSKAENRIASSPFFWEV